MEATAILRTEHRVISGVLDTLAEGAAALKTGGAVRPGFFLDAATFIKGFADDCHHHKEEGFLFPAMERAGVAVQGGPIGAMLAEHEQGRRYARAMRAAAERLDAGDPAAAPEVVAAAEGYVELLRQHIRKEDSVLFPLAERVIPADARDELEAGFERVEREETGEGVHERFEALAEALRAEFPAAEA